MELSDLARAIVLATTLDGKLTPIPPRASDRARGAPVRLQRPGRPAGLEIAPARQVRVPPPEGMGDPAQRAREDLLLVLLNHNDFVTIR